MHLLCPELLLCRYVLRNWMAQQAIERAEEGDFSEVQRLLALLRDPFSEDGEGQEEQGPVASGAAGFGLGGEAADNDASRAGDGAGGQGAGPSAACILRRYDGPVPQKYSSLFVTCSS
jgi:hypothetical protein